VKQEDIEEFQVSKVSLMPTELLKTFDDHEVRSLIAYLSGDAQVPVLATHENVAYFFTGKDLNFWDFGRAGWKLDQGELLPAEPAPELMTSDILLADDFHFTLQFHPGKDGGGAVDVRGAESKPDSVRVRFSAGKGLSTVRTDNAGAGTPLEKPGAANPVRADAWNKLEIIVVGKRMQVRLNGKEAADWEGDDFLGRRVIALQGAEGSGQSIRFRNLDLRLLSVNKRAN
jgi:hypothetical protein